MADENSSKMEHLCFRKLSLNFSTFTRTLKNKVPMKKITSLFACFAIYILSFAQGTWTQKANFGGAGRSYATGFSIGTKGYMGTGTPDGGTTAFNDFWEWDQATNVWTQKANFAGVARYGAVGFSISNKGYIGTGKDVSANSYNDFWEYDQSGNTWTAKANILGNVRNQAVGFSIGTKGYVGTGIGTSGNGLNDFYEWDQATNVWTSKASVSTIVRASPVGFSIGTKGYIGTGMSMGATRLQDFWEWDQATNVWTQKADFAGTARWLAVGFSIGTNGYIGTGNDGTSKQDFWEWDQATNVWTQKANFSGTARSLAVGFSVGTKGYIGTGNTLNDFWEYSLPCNVTLTPSQTYASSCNGNDGTATITPAGGALPYFYLWSNSQTTQTATGLSGATYSVLVTDNVGCTATASITITQSPALTLSITATNSTCSMANGTATAIPSGGALPYSYLWSNSQTTQTATGLSAATYSITVTDNSGCTATSSINIIQSPAWTQKANFGGTTRDRAVGFSIGTKGYFGTGTPDGGITAYSDFWEWDQATNVWTQKANFSGGGRFAAVGFSIGTKGYIGTGNYGGYKRDFWEYNSITNIWTQKANVGGTARADAVGFSIGTKGYIGTGDSTSTYKQDFWEYDPNSNTWTQKANFGGGVRNFAIGFSIGTKGYIGTGYNGSVSKQDFWEYDPSANSWTQKANLIGSARNCAVGFSIVTKGYIGTGVLGSTYYQDFYEWDQATNTWTQKANFGGTARDYAVGFSIGNKGYIGTGYDLSYKNDFWEFTPSCNLTLSVTVTNSSCGQATGTASVVATGGNTPFTYQWTNGDNSALADSLSAGLYTVLVTDASGSTAQMLAVISDAGAPVITVVSATNVSCNGGSNGAINISVTGGSQPYTYFWVNGATTQDISNLTAAPYEIEVTDANGCKSSKSILVTEPAPISLVMNTINASCGNADGSATVVASGGTGVFTYLWSNSASTASATGLSAGNYSVTVTDNNGCSNITQATIINIGGAIVTLDSIKPAGCNSGTGSIYVTVTGGVLPYTYAWSNGATTQDLIGVAPSTYGLVVHGGNSCIGAFNATIPSQIPFAPTICMVTVDTATGTNQCLFEKDSILNLGISHYNIYRETSSSGVYVLIGNKPAHQLSVWTDPSANPQQQAWRYKISAVDTCGIESPISNFHKTIHLSANIGLGNVVNLIWDNYEGFNYSTYIIWRYTQATGWDSINSVAGNPTITYNSYTDLTPPTLINLHYFIQIKNPFGCTPSVFKYSDPSIMATTVNNSKSNTYKIGNINSVNEISLDNLVNIFPNPSNGQFRIQSAGFRVKSLEVYNLFGEVIHSEIVNSSSFAVHLTLSNGIYFAYLKTEKGIVVKKIIVNN